MVQKWPIFLWSWNDFYNMRRFEPFTWFTTLGMFFLFLLSLYLKWLKQIDISEWWLFSTLDPRISLEVRKGLLLILCCAWCNMCLPCSVRTMTFVPDAIQVFEIKTNFIGCFNTGDFVEKLYFMVTSHKFDLWPIVTETS